MPEWPAATKPVATKRLQPGAKCRGPVRVDVRRVSMVGGEIHFAIDGIPANVPLIKAGTLQALATTGLQRTPALPDVPTLHELGVTGFEVRPWNGFSVPKGTPRAVVDKIQRDTREVLQNPAIREQLLALGQEVIGTTPEEFVETIRRDTAKYGPIVKELGLKVQ